MREITGTMYAYSFLCERKLWYFSRQIAMEEEHENVAIGKWLDENTYTREQKHLLVDDVINVDFIHKNVVCEVKKSDAHLEMAENQLKYYLYILQKKGLDVQKGVINIPLQKMRKQVELKASDHDGIKERLEHIGEILECQRAPEAILLKACGQCAYFELCFI